MYNTCIYYGEEKLACLIVNTSLKNSNGVTATARIKIYSQLSTSSNHICGFKFGVGNNIKIT